MKSIPNLFAICMLLVIACGSCASPGTLTPKPVPSATPELKVDWWVSWLAQPVCKPPCWQNITPGVTTKDEAVSIVENLPDSTITYNREAGLTWEHKSKLEGGDIRFSENEVVSSIRLGSISANKLLLKVIVASYGDPEFVEAYDCGGEVTKCSIALIYPDLGMFLDIYKDNKGENAASPKFEISPDDKVYDVYFFEPGLGNFTNLYTLQESVPLQWKGINEYP